MQRQNKEIIAKPTKRSDDKNPSNKSCPPYKPLAYTDNHADHNYRITELPEYIRRANELLSEAERKAVGTSAKR